MWSKLLAGTSVKCSDYSWMCGKRGRSAFISTNALKSCSLMAAGIRCLTSAGTAVPKNKLSIINKLSEFIGLNMLAVLPGQKIKCRHCSELRERAGTAAAVFWEAADQCHSLSGFFLFITGGIKMRIVKYGFV